MDMLVVLANMFWLLLSVMCLCVTILVVALTFQGITTLLKQKK